VYVLKCVGKFNLKVSVITKLVFGFIAKLNSIIIHRLRKMIMVGSWLKPLVQVFLFFQRAFLQFFIALRHLGKVLKKLKITAFKYTYQYNFK